MRLAREKRENKMMVRLLERIPVMGPEEVAEAYPEVNHWILPEDEGQDFDITFAARILAEDGMEAIYMGTPETYRRYVLACAMELECKGVN